MSERVIPGELVTYSPRVRRIAQKNPGPFTGPGTNTHLVGREELVLLDPGPEDDAHLERLLAAIGTVPVAAVVSSHSHPDHWPLAPVLARRLGAPVCGFAERGDFRPDRRLADGELLRTVDASLEVLHTPGHASDHLCFRLVEERALFSGDHVMGWSTSIISPPDGNLRAYMSSLARLAALDLERLYPAHGPPVDTPHRRIEEIRRHRLERTEQALDALADQGGRSIPELVAAIYTDTPPHLHAAAERSLLAHLEALVEAGRVEEEGEEGEPRRYRLAS